MDTTLPVWTIRPNWKGGILERLEWLTDVLASDTGVEQRRSVRASPRRSIEITVNPTNQDRTYLDLILHRLGGETWLFPLWFDKARVSASVEIGDTRVPCDNTFREFTDGGLALLYRDTFTWEVISISGQDDTGLDLDVPLDNDWGKGVALYPLRQALMPVDTKLDALTSRVGESVILFQLAEANDYPEVMPEDTFSGIPVLGPAPNRSQTITVDQVRAFDERDGQIGLVYRQDRVGRAFEAQAHNWTIVGREAQANFRSMLYWLRGKQRALWMPTFNDDVELSQPAAAGAASLTIKKIGMGYVGVVPGRDLIRIDGQVVKIDSVGAALSPDEELLVLEAPTGAAIPKGRCGSFLDAARLDSDTLELHHHADTNGALECGVTFRTFSDTRTTAGPLLVPIPEAEQTDTTCGSPEGDNPCDLTFPGWYWEVTMLIGATGGDNPYTPYANLHEGNTIYGDSPDLAPGFNEGPWYAQWFFSTDYPSGSQFTCLEQLDTLNLIGITITEPGNPPDNNRPAVHMICRHWDQAVGVDTLPQPFALFRTPTYITFDLP